MSAHKTRTGKQLNFLKILLLFTVLSAVYSCNYSDNRYTFNREYDNGTYITSRGVAKYISGTPDTAVVTRDVYAIIKEKVTYSRNKEDSILVYGHCWSLSSKPRVSDSTATKYMIDANSDFKPDAFIDTLVTGSVFTSVLSNLIPETQYYARSYVITGKIVDGEAVYKDTAYNPVTFNFVTQEPKDVWEEREAFLGLETRGAISFVYKNELYVGMGYNEFSIYSEIYKYVPQTDSWVYVSKYKGVPSTNAVCFVMENVKVAFGVYYDFVYIGTGTTNVLDPLAVTNEFWRWNPNTDEWAKFSGMSIFPGASRQNAIAFTLEDKGYVAFGTGGSGSTFKDLWVFDPEDVDENHVLGTWKYINNHPTNEGRTKAVAFVIDNNAFIMGGEAEPTVGNKIMRKDLYMFRQTYDGNGAWAKKRDFPGTARIDAVGFAIENIGYVGTGWDGDSLRSDFWRYNPYVNEWEQRAYFKGLPRREAVGGGLQFSENDFRGYIGTGIGPTNTDYYLDFWHYRP